MPRISLESHFEKIETFIHRRLLRITNECLRFDHNQTLFFLLTLSRDPLWRSRVKKLHPKTRPFHIAGRCFLCEWELIWLDLHGLVDRLIDIGPYDEPPTLNTKDDTPPPPVEEDTEDEELKGENELIGGRMSWIRDPLRRETLERNPQLSMNLRKTLRSNL